MKPGLAWMTMPLAGYEAAGDIRKPYGSGVAEIVPYQAFQTKDGWLMIAAGNDNLFRKFCDGARSQGPHHRPDFVSNSQRVINRERLIPIVAEEVSRFGMEELGERLDAVGVPNSPLLGVRDVAHHPQTKAIDMTVDLRRQSVAGFNSAFLRRRTAAQCAARAETR